MATPGIDVAVIGPGDLATSINKRGRVDDPELLELVARAEAGILRSGVPIGGVARTADQANELIDRGYRAIALGFDWSLFQRGIMNRTTSFDFTSLAMNSSMLISVSFWGGALNDSLGPAQPI